MQIGQRVRYNLWQALADIGGIHDGLGIIAKALIGPFVANLFHYDLVKKSRQDLSKSKSLKQMRLKLMRKIVNNEPELLGQEADFKAIMMTFNGLKKVKIKLWHHAIHILCRCFRKHKGYSAVQKLVNFQTNQLDIRRIITNSVALRDFLRCFLNQP